jgi:DivIVA domain-containing protein
VFNDETAPTRFTLALRGYDPEEVEAHLASVQEQLDALQAEVLESKHTHIGVVEELANSRREVAELQDKLEAHERGQDSSSSVALDDIGHRIAEILRTAQDQADQIRSAAEAAAEEIRTGAGVTATEIRDEARASAAELRRAAAEEAEAIIANAQSRADADTEQAQAEARRLTDSAATEESNARQLRVEADYDRGQAAAMLAAAHDDAERVVEQGRTIARLHLRELVDERDRLLDQLISVASGFDERLSAENAILKESERSEEIEWVDHSGEEDVASPTTA